MSINYNNIKELVSLLYIFVYDKDNVANNNYTYQRLSWSEIKISDLINPNLDYQLILNSNFETKDNFKIKKIF